MKTIKFLSLILLITLFSCNNINKKGTKNDPFIDQPSQDLTEKEELPVPLYLSTDIMCGTVQFNDGCGLKVDSLIKFGLALIHHMTYDDAEMVFKQVVSEDPDCFWGYWGRAMTFIHPLWPDQPSHNQMVMGNALSQRALSMATSETQITYGNALAAYYENGLDKSEKERLRSYNRAWKTAHDERPEDLESQLFYALTSLALVPEDDKSYEIQKSMGALAEQALEVIPDHPGGFHYAIHAYDFPPLAGNAIRVASNYSKIAPEIPHALHMPTHIFTRLGYWDESIEMNIRSAEAAWTQPAGDNISLHYLHALDYLTHGYLQRGESKKAQEIYDSVVKIDAKFQDHSASAYALAAIPGRIAIDSKSWEKASKIELPHRDNYPWDKYPQFESLLYYARGIGAARNFDSQVAHDAIEKLKSLQNDLGSHISNNYWYNQIEIQKLAVMAWYEYAVGEKQQALTILCQAAEMESRTEKNPITPGEIVQVRELLGDMLFEMGNYAAALNAYQEALENSPDRFNTLFGAGKSAEMNGDNDKANQYFKRIIEIKGSDADRIHLLTYASNRITI